MACARPVLYCPGLVRDDRLHPPVWDRHAYSLNRLREALETALGRPGVAAAGDTVVDVGAGDAPYRSLFEARDCRHLTCDIDGSPDVVIEPEGGLPLESASVEGVVSFQVLEHVWDVDRYLRECRRILRGGGWLILSTHGSWPYHPHPSDFRRWTREGIVREIEEAGFRVETVFPLVGPPAWMANFPLLAAWTGLRRIPVVGPALLVPLGAVLYGAMTLLDAITPGAIRDDNAAIYLTLARAVDPA
jgi:SAM-dependent methyltransferase